MDYRDLKRNTMCTPNFMLVSCKDSRQITICTSDPMFDSVVLTSNAEGTAYPDIPPNQQFLLLNKAYRFKPEDVGLIYLKANISMPSKYEYVFPTIDGPVIGNPIQVVMALEDANYPVSGEWDKLERFHDFEHYYEQCDSNTADAVIKYLTMSMFSGNINLNTVTNPSAREILLEMHLIRPTEQEVIISQDMLFSAPRSNKEMMSACRYYLLVANLLDAGEYNK